MSFSGYFSCLCLNGHSFHFDVYDPNPTENPKWKCPTCDAGLAWWSLVDETNSPSVGLINLEIETPAKYCECPKCGNTHIVKRETYKIPTEGGHKVPPAECAPNA